MKKSLVFRRTRQSVHKFVLMMKVREADDDEYMITSKSNRHSNLEEGNVLFGKRVKKEKAAIFEHLTDKITSPGLATDYRFLRAEGTEVCDEFTADIISDIDLIFG
ncbi:hypothetical protein SK128_003541 [Halocaridina rubra]|uniref:Uncharacterized protein n=1 Tax=Halocaridina rubra TaxID=373956 RepID=A0AAN9AFB0_HALRR